MSGLQIQGEISLLGGTEKIIIEVKQHLLFLFMGSNRLITNRKIRDKVSLFSVAGLFMEEVLASPSFKYKIWDLRRAIVLSKESRAKQCFFKLPFSHNYSTDRNRKSCAISSLMADNLGLCALCNGPLETDYRLCLACILAQEVWSQITS